MLINYLCNGRQYFYNSYSANTKEMYKNANADKRATNGLKNSINRRADETSDELATFSCRCS